MRTERQFDPQISKLKCQKLTRFSLVFEPTFFEGLAELPTNALFN